MMKPDTPLPEVALLLPRSAAQVLLLAPLPVQESVLGMMRSMILSLERRGHTLDPIELEAVLNVYVGTITALCEALYEERAKRP